ncbi:MAG: DinB family protein [Nitrolancea sp.]
MDAVDLLRGQLQSAHSTLEATVGDISSEDAHRDLGGHACPVAANYAHTVLGEDMLGSLADGSQPLAMGAWGARTGVSEIPPMDGQWEAWGKSVNVDLAQLREYAQAVYGKTMGILSSMSAEDLDRPVDLSMLGMGQQNVGVLLGLLASHAAMHTGEISNSKGVQGLKGYPF